MSSHPLTPGTHTALLNALKIHYTVLAASPSLQAILVHPPPWGLGASLYIKTFAHLSSQFTVIIPSPRGNDSSQRPPSPQEMSSRHIVADLEALRLHLGLDTFHALIGHSAGGVIALGYAITYPERVERLVLLNPDLLGYVHEDISLYHDAKTLFSENPPQNDIEFRAFILKMLPYFFCLPDLGGPEDFIKNWTNTPSLRAYRAYFAADLASPSEWVGGPISADGNATWRQIDELGRVTARTLLLAGLEDGVTGVQIASYIARGVRRSVLGVSDACGHVGFVERPDVVWECLEGFLEEDA